MTKEYKLDDLRVLFPENAESSRLLVGCSYADYSASRIARAVEDCDARLLNMNVTGYEPEETQMAVALRVSHRDPERVAQSLERYGYTILSLEGAGREDDDRLRRHYDELMKYLEI